MTVSAFGISHRGRVRDTNQDRLLIADLGDSRAEPKVSQRSDAVAVGPLGFTVGGGGALLMVADGMGGRLGGARASEVAVETVHSELMSGLDSRDPGRIADMLGAALAVANETILDEGLRSDEHRGMGTTATLAGLCAGFVVVAQVGDSRAYLARSGKLARLTRDQSLVQSLIDLGVVTEDEAQNVPRNQIMQALGATSAVEPVFTSYELRRRDLLLLCSDGLSGVVSDAELEAAIRGAHDCAALCDRLVTLANRRGGPDNITVLAARLDGDALEEPSEDDDVEPRGDPKR
jgi:serine/threonine protein phosphatase PrpC